MVGLLGRGAQLFFKPFGEHSLLPFERPHILLRAPPAGSVLPQTRDGSPGLSHGDCSQSRTKETPNSGMMGKEGLTLRGSPLLSHLSQMQLYVPHPQCEASHVESGQAAGTGPGQASSGC